MSKVDRLNDKEKEILEIIRAVPDPEVGVNIVDLGLIYEITYDEDQKRIDIVMTLSARGCPVGDTIVQQVQTIVSNMFMGFQVNVELVWEPAWNPDMISDAGRAALGGRF